MSKHQPIALTLKPGESVTTARNFDTIYVDDVLCPHLSVSGEARTSQTFECKPCGVSVSYTVTQSRG